MNKTNRSEYAAGYAAHINGLPIPHTVSRAWARGFHDAWRKIATGEIKGCRDAWKEAHA